MRHNFPTPGARRRLAVQFGLEWSPEMQDWEIEVADQDRVSEFAEVLSQTNDVEEQLSLFELVVASFDEWLVASAPDSDEALEHWQAIKPTLDPFVDEFRDVIHYWLRSSVPVSHYVALLLSDPN